jgi:hypothetical protein
VRIPDRRFLQGALALPLVTPLVLAALFNPAEGSSVGADLSAVLLVSLAYGGLPYLAFAVGLLIWGRGKRVVDLVWMAALVPLMFSGLAVVTVGAFIAYLADAGGKASAFLLYGASAFGYTIVLGYSYVGIVMLIRALLLRLGVIEWEHVALE